MGPKAVPARPRRTHVLGGCINCRRRHTKCDQVQPRCLTCQAVGQICEGYDSSVQWVTQGRDLKAITEEKSGTRRHLYTVQSRVSMSVQLMKQIGTSSLDSTLNTIDSWAERLGKSASDGFVAGPFSVIDLSVTTTPALLPSIQPLDNNANATDTSLSLETTSSLPDCLQWSDLFDLDFENYLASLPELSHIDTLPTNDEQTIQSQPLIVSNEIDTLQLPITPSSMINDHDVKSAAHSLLRHFSQNVIPSIGALPFNTKSPWQILNVSSAVQTLADIIYLGREIKHANAANLYGIMACSAYHLASNPSGPGVEDVAYWTEIAERAGKKARGYMQHSLQYELPEGHKAKYKDQLMAITSNLVYSISSGQQKETRRYMVDAERLLRLRGLAKRHISRRARLLHHMYTWLRIVGESTYVLHDLRTPTSTILNPTRITATEAGHSSKLDDFLRLDSVDDGDMHPEEIKEPGVGLVDIHLEDPRSHPETMYFQIYGIPESWLSLLSQTTRLANVTDMLKTATNDKSDMQKMLEKRAARLEDMICSFAAKIECTPTNIRLPPSQHMLRALNSALVIFFYRRIRHVNPWILQSHVDDVITALNNFDLSLSQADLSGPGTAWPAFIAGCEANAGSRRNSLLQWVETAFWKTGLQPYKSAQDMMREVWTRRDQAATSPRSSRTSINADINQGTKSWVEICRERKEWVILC